MKIPIYTKQELNNYVKENNGLPNEPYVTIIENNSFHQGDFLVPYLSIDFKKCIAGSVILPNRNWDGNTYKSVKEKRDLTKSIKNYLESQLGQDNLENRIAKLKKNHEEFMKNDEKTFVLELNTSKEEDLVV
ncbi:MAG: hypothetical protein VW298_00365 [Candidatus Woesearchaeota archaeon]